MRQQGSLVIERERITERISFQIETWEDDHKSHPTEKYSNSKSASSESSEIVHCGAQHQHKDPRFPAQAGFLSPPNSITGEHHEPSQ